MKTRTLLLVRCSLCLAAVAAGAPAAWALGMPLHEQGGSWTPIQLHEVGVLQLRVEVAPARDPDRDVVMWSVDETMLVRNSGEQAVDLHIGVPNAWSAGDSSVTLPDGDFWAEVLVNGAPVATQLANVVINPAFPSVVYRAARVFDLHLDSGEAAQVRLLFALPAETNSAGEQLLHFPFHLRTLWDGPIEAGVVVLRWPDRMYGFRSNLPDYALSADRAEWFIYQFNPNDALEVRFLSRQTVFHRVAEQVGCPMPWEVMDRVSSGAPQGMRDMLASYDDQRLALCADLPAALRGSLSAAREAGLDTLRLEQFLPEGSGITGPLFVEDPTFQDSDLTQSEALYARFLRQELDLRRGH